MNISQFFFLFVLIYFFLVNNTKELEGRFPKETFTWQSLMFYEKSNNGN